MVVPIVVGAGLITTIIFNDTKWITFALALGLMWHEMLMYDIHDHVKNIEWDLNE